jgi:HSP20 family protein
MFYTTHKETPNFSKFMKPVFSELVGELFNEVNKVDGITYKPLANILENDESFEIQLSIAGYNKEEVTIKLENDLLIIESKDISQVDENFKLCEFKKLAFKRSFNISKEVNREGIKAAFDLGLLKITLPKAEVKPATTIEIL